MAGTPLAGTGGRVKVDSVTLNAGKWSIEPQVNDLITTNFESTGTDGFTYEEGITTGIRACPLTIEMFWDADQNPHSDPPNIKAGTLIDSIELHLDKDLIMFTADQARVLGTPIICDVNGVIQITVNCRTNGQYSYPS